MAAPKWSQQLLAEKKKQQQKNVFATPLVWISPFLQHLIQSFCAMSQPRTVCFRGKKVFALQSWVFSGALNSVRRPHDFERSKEMEWDPSTPLYFTRLTDRRRRGVPRVWLRRDGNGQDASAHIKASSPSDGSELMVHQEIILVWQGRGQNLSRF